MKRMIICITTMLMFVPVFSQGSQSAVSKVDIRRYAGKWYEIAKLPNSFEKN